MYKRQVRNYFKHDFDKVKALEATGYKSARLAVGQVFGRPRVKKLIEKQMERSRMKFDLTEAWIIQRSMKLADANLGKIKLKLQQNNNDLSCLTDDELYAISEISEEQFMMGRGEMAQEAVKRKIKVEPRLGHLTMLAKRLGLLQDNVKVEGSEELIAALRAGRAQVGEDG